MGGVEVLELVDQQVPAAPLRRAAGLGVAQEDLDRPVDLLVEVDRAGLGQRRPVGVESVGQALRVRDELFDLRPVRSGPSRTADSASM